jgi:hypothetical protein
MLIQRSRLTVMQRLPGSLGCIPQGVSFLSRRFIISLFLTVLTITCARAADPYTVISPTGVSATDTINIISALPNCTSSRGLFLGEGTFKVVITVSVPNGCTITASNVGSPTASAAGVQNTTVDCSGLVGTTPCFVMGNSAVLTGFTIIGNGNTALTNTNCIDQETITGGSELLNLVLRNCGVGMNIGASSCCTQNVRVINAVFLNNGYGLYCHGNCTDGYYSDLTIISPTSEGVICCSGGSGQLNRIMIQNLPSGGIGLDLRGVNFMPVTAVSVSGAGTCIALDATNSVPINSVRCTGDGGANEHCLSFAGGASSVVQESLVGINCTGGYNGTGSSVVIEPSIQGGCQLTCNIDVIWNGTDPLYDSVATEGSIDFVRYTRSVSFFSVPLTGTAFAAPDPANGFNQSFVLTSSCSAPCTVPAPVYVQNGQRGYLAFTQPATALTSPISWGSAYRNTAQPFNGNAKTTWFPWVANSDDATVTLGTLVHN